MTNEPAGVYLYAIVKAARRPPQTRTPPGVPGASSPDIVPVDRGLWLVTAIVPLDVYGPGILEPRLGDLDWVSHIAVAHEAVIEHFAAKPALTVIPMTLFTMFSSIDKAVADVRRRRAVLAPIFRRITGAEEWGIRVLRSTNTADAFVRGEGRPVTGADFLVRRKAARDAAGVARKAAAVAAAQAFGRLSRLARRASRRESRPEAGSNPPVLEAAFLVRKSARAAFRAEARRQAARCAAAGGALMLSGPWPAYNFVGDQS